MTIRRFSRLQLVCLFCTLAAVLTPRIYPQATTGNILGRVTDSTGATVVNAMVTATNVGTGFVQSAKTTDTGYTLWHLLPGTYTVTVDHPGFKKETRSGILLAIDQKLVVDFLLTAGSVTETVTVTGIESGLQTRSVETGQVVGSAQILDLPLDGRDFMDFTHLTAGTSNGGGGNSLNLSVNGQREFSNSILINGVESTSNRGNDTTLGPSVDAVQEFKISTSDYSAQYGHASGGVIAVQIKSGTNQLHGSLYEFYRPSSTAAENYAFSGSTGQPPQIQRHDFGGTVGLPIRKDKTMLFISYEQLRLINTLNWVDSVPPVNQLNFLSNGDVDASGLRDPSTGNQIPIFDPNVTYTNYGGWTEQFPGNVIPASEVSTAGKAALQNFFPKPNLPGESNGWYSNFQVNTPYEFHSRSSTMRVDHTVSDADRLAFVYQYNDYNDREEDPFWGAIPVKGGGDADRGLNEDNRSQAFTVNETHLFSPRLVNEASVGYTRFRYDDWSLLNGQDLSTQYGMSNVYVPGYSATKGYPYIYLGSGYTTGGSTFKPLRFRDTNIELLDNVTFSTSRGHELHWGGDYRVLHSRPIFSIFPTGFQYFAGPYQYAPNGPNTGDPTYGSVPPYYYDSAAAFPNGGSDMTDLLLGVPADVYMGLQLTNPHTSSWQLGFYGEDVWALTPRVVLTLGLRYEYQNPWVEGHHQASNFDPTTGLIQIAGRGSNAGGLINSRKNDFAPRLGLTYQLSKTSVLRGGFGVFYTPEDAGRSSAMSGNYPFGVQQTFINSIYSGLPYAYGLDSGVERSTAIPLASGASSIDPATIPNGSLQTVSYTDPNMRTAYSFTYNLTFEHQFAPRLTFDLSYVGSESHRLLYGIGDINVPDPATGLHRITQLLGHIQALEAAGMGKYNSMQAKLDKQYNKNLGFIASYTWSHNIDNGPAPFDLGNTGTNRPQNPFNLRAEVASADSDQRHVVAFSPLYKLPFGNGQRYLSGTNRIQQVLLGGWQLNAILAAHSGLPVNVVRNAEDQNYPGMRPNLVGNPNLPRDKRKLNEYFNTAAFSTAGLTEATPGTAGRNIVRGPGFINLDFSILKDITIIESGGKPAQSLQLRFESFNLTNTPHFGTPGANMASAANFGRIRQVANEIFGGPRILQFGAKYVF